MILKEYLEQHPLLCSITSMEEVLLVLLRTGKTPRKVIDFSSISMSVT